MTTKIIEWIEAQTEPISFKIEKCYICGWMVICPRCGNNCCNGGYGEDKDGTKCFVCPIAYDVQDLLYKEQDNETNKS